MNNLPCTSCVNHIGNRCALLHSPQRFREYLAIRDRGVCPFFAAMPGYSDCRTGSSGAIRICDACCHWHPAAGCKMHRGCDSQMKVALAVRTGECRLFSPLPARATGRHGEEMPRSCFVTTAEMAQESQNLAFVLAHIKPNTIIGVARSGLPAASIIATALHVPLWVTSPVRKGLWHAGNGYRLGRTPANPAPPFVIVDDTASYGGTLADVRQALAEKIDLRLAYTAVVYSTREAAKRIDFVGRLYEPPHYLEWCFANTFWAEHLAYDFDGILCADPPCYDTEAGYAEFLRDAPPKYLPRKWPATIISARCEFTRQASLDWLHRHGIQVGELVLWPHTPDERWKQRETVAMWKASEITARTDIFIYAESDPWQAQVISQAAKIPVICPAAKQVFGIEYWREA